MSPVMTEAERQHYAWSIYLQHENVFASVLAATGPWPANEGTDLIHDFLIERLPKSLRSYDPNVGPIPPWLYTVFLNYAKRRLIDQRSLHKKWVSLTDLPGPANEQLDQSSSSSVADQTVSNTDHTVKDALDRLPIDHRSVLLTFFGGRPNAGNLRATARQLQCSRHQVRRVLFEALGELAIALQGKGVLSEEELLICQDFLLLGKSWKQISEKTRIAEQEAELLLRSALRALCSSLTRIAFHLICDSHKEKSNG